MIHDPTPISPINPEGLDDIALSLLNESETLQPESPTSISLENLAIEQASPRDSNNNKILYVFDKSLEALKQRGFQRHLRPSEAFKVIIDAIENPSSKYKPLKEDMLSSHGEWLSIALERTKPSELTFYLDPENLIWNGSQYVVKGSLQYSGKQSFPISKNIPSQQYVDLNKFPNELVKFLYSRKFKDLPKIMQSGDKRAQTWLPQKGIVRPCYHNGFNGFVVGSDYFDRASRGVRVAKN